jgi:hypothetical protein
MSHQVKAEIVAKHSGPTLTAMLKEPASWNTMTNMAKYESIL